MEIIEQSQLDTTSTISTRFDSRTRGGTQGEAVFNLSLDMNSTFVAPPVTAQTFGSLPSTQLQKKRASIKPFGDSTSPLPSLPKPSTTYRETEQYGVYTEQSSIITIG